VRRLDVLWRRVGHPGGDTGFDAKRGLTIDEKGYSRWVRKAEGDYQAAAVIGDSVIRSTLFSLFASAEKYLKSLLEELGQPIERTRELEKLLD
jgi:HEPN domain-containing protein